MKRVHIASFPDAQFGKSTEAKNKGGRSRLKSVPAKGCVPGDKDSGHLNQPREVVSTPCMVPVCGGARTGALPRRSPL